jgi:hypothetical protein
VPGQQGGGRDAEGCPRRTRKHSTEEGQHSTIGWLEDRTSHLASEDCHFVAQSEELDLLGLFATKEQESQPEEVTEAEIDEGP